MTNLIEKETVNVVATSYVRETKEKIITRIEVVNLKQGMWGKYDTWTEEQVKDYYESFWNDINPNSKNIVLVDVIC
jgi:hypothetical protein